MQKWVIVQKSGDFTEIAKRQGISPVIARLLVNRNVAEADMGKFLHGSLEDLHDPHLMKDMDKCVEIIIAAIKAKKKIRVIGDYDIDGICSSYILEHGIRNCFEKINNCSPNDYVDTVLPHRIEDGYGLNIKLIDRAIEEGVELIITCDNGISALQEVEYGKSKGIDFVITDHHELPYHEENGEKIYEMPKALAVVNPKRPDCEYPFREICAGMVVYKIIQALYELCMPEGDVTEFLEFAAFATVGDIMPLCDENRIVVKQGLKAMKNTRNMGLRTLMEVCELDKSEYISAYHLGFILGPCLNAAGRIDEALVARRLLDCKDKSSAIKLAQELRQFNEERKELTQKGVDQAVAYIEALDEMPDVLVVYLPDCHESIAGIVAGKLKENYCHPAIVLTRTESGVKGSGRSIEEYDLHASLIECRELFSKFGGHKLAAGLSMEAGSDEECLECVERLREALNSKSNLTADCFMEKIKIDMLLSFNFIDENLCAQLELLEPIGMGNRKPVFAAQDVTLKEGRIIGKNKNVFKAYAVDSTGYSFETIMFDAASVEPKSFSGRTDIKMVFSPDINEYNGRRSVQLIAKGIK